MTDAPRILLVAAANATSGGGEKHVADLMRRLPAHGFDVSLAAPAGGDLNELAAELGIRTFEAPIASGLTPGKIAAVRQAIERLDPDVVHAHGSRAALFARQADPRAAERVVYTVHGIHVDKSDSALKRSALLWTERYLRPKTVAFVTVCASDREGGARLGILDQERTVVIYNGIELPVAEPSEPGRFRRELGLDERDRIVLHVGRMERQKDQATLLRAWANVAPAVPHSYLAIVGRGSLSGELRELASSYGIAERVRFVEPRPSLASAYADADIFALSSLWEGLPYVVLEAMAYRLPVVATAVDGIPEAVEEGTTGLLLAPGDFRGIAGALHRLLDSAERRAVMGESGAERVAEHFTVDRMVKQLAGVYRGVATRGATHEETS